MITAVDTSILLDVFLPDEKHVEESARLLRTAYDEGGLVVSHLVYAELVPHFGERTALEGALSRIGILTADMDDEVAFRAGTAWRSYRDAGGTRERIITDFVIGAHALLRADRFLTRDRGFYRSYFHGLAIMTAGE